MHNKPTENIEFVIRPTFRAKPYERENKMITSSNGVSCLVWMACDRCPDQIISPRYK